MPVSGPFVIKLGGALMDEPAALTAICRQVAGMHAAQPGCVVIVHGGGKAVDRQLAALGMTTERREGIRITPPEQVLQISGVLSGQVNAQLVASMIAAGSCACGLRLADAGLATCARATHLGFDPGCVGSVTGGDPRGLRALLAAGVLPVISSIGTSAAGELLNVNADDAAAAVASILGARGLVFLTDVPGVLDAGRSIIPSLDAAAIDRLVHDGTIGGGMIPKVRGALDTAATTGVAVTIAGWTDPANLSNLLTGGVAGTRITAPTTLSCP
jgi:acetylglutamate kinase